MNVITRRFEIDVGHRLMKHEGKCRNVHGHRYVIDLTLSAPKLDEVGRVMDFGAIKSLFGMWLDGTYDHGFVAQEGDPIIEFLAKNDQKYIVLPVPPTIENLVKEWFNMAKGMLGEKGMRVVNVRGYETPNCWADYRGET